MYKEGCTEQNMVRQIQEALGIKVDGVFGKQTTAAVIAFQMKHSLVADGIVGPKTLNVLGILDTDLRNQIITNTTMNFTIHKHYLPKGEYISDTMPILNDYVMLHHTGGWENPFKTIDDWGRDDRGAIATEFVIGGQNIKTRESTYDGTIVQAFPTGNQGWHVGGCGSSYMVRHTVGIELCNFGQLTEELKNYVGIRATETQVVRLENKFKNYWNYHKYSEAQLISLKKLLLFVAARDNIDITKGICQWIRNDVSTAFDVKQDAYDGKVKGLLLHCNVRKDKFDLSPQPELIDMLLTL